MKKIIYTGKIDEYFDYCHGELEYRSLTFRTELKDVVSIQQSAVVNYTEAEVPYTRAIEHKKFVKCDKNIPFSVISYEYPADYKKGGEAYYAINNSRNNSMYEKYKEMADNSNVFFGGRLGSYKYLNMHEVFEQALNDIPKLTV